MWEAIRVLRCARLDHGVRAMEDPACVAFLEQTQVPLTVCPRSNYMVRTGLRFHRLLYKFAALSVGSGQESTFNRVPAT